MEEHETVLSEVHVGLPVCSTSTDVVSRFEFAVPEALSVGSEEDRQLSDDEGDSDDQSPPRRDRVQHEVLLIGHRMATRLCDVGLQVWPAALTMADFLLSEHRKFKDCVLLEIGGGVGLCGLVASRVARRVICSEYKQEIVDVMQSNFSKNPSVVRSEYECIVLDVTVDEPVECDFVFGSDLIYDDGITDAILKFIKKLLSGNTAAFFLSLEKRLNFTTDEMEVCCPAYRHFRDSCSREGLIARSVDLDNVPRFFVSLPRSRHIELLEITVTKNQ